MKEEIKEKALDVAKKGASNLKEGMHKAAEFTVNAKDKTLEVSKEAIEKVVTTIDQNGNEEIDIEDVIILAMKTPGVRVKRSDFLNKELSNKYPTDIIAKAVETTPARAKIDANDINKIADEVIKQERVVVSGISTALGVPGGAALVATIPADIAQYYGSMLRVAQKLLYLYGFPQIQVGEEGSSLDTETINVLTLCLGVMYGVANANNAIKSIAKAFATGVEKKLLNTALTKGTIYPIVKEVAKWFGKKMTKEVFAGFFKKAIPVAGGVVGGGITFATFKPCCDKLKNELKNTKLANPDINEDDEIIDITEEEIEVVE